MKELDDANGGVGFGSLYRAHLRSLLSEEPLAALPVVKTYLQGKLNEANWLTDEIPSSLTQFGIMFMDPTGSEVSPEEFKEINDREKHDIIPPIRIIYPGKHVSWSHIFLNKAWMKINHFRKG